MALGLGIGAVMLGQRGPAVAPLSESGFTAIFDGKSLASWDCDPDFWKVDGGAMVGETTADGRVTLLTVECLCACEQAPMMQVDERYEGLLTPEKVDRIIEGLS